MSFLKNNWKWLVTTLIGTAAVVVPTYYSTNSNNIDLRYEVISSSQVVAFEDENVDKIEVLFNGVKIEKPYLTEIKLINMGDLPIMPEKYEGYLYIDLGEVRIIDASIKKKEPKEIRAEIKYEKNRVMFVPTLLNPNDYVVMKVLTSNGEPVVGINVRIAGLKGVLPVDKDVNLRNRILTILQFCLALILSIGYAISTTIHIDRDKQAKSIYAPVKSIVFLVFCTIISLNSAVIGFSDLLSLPSWGIVIMIPVFLVVGEFLMRIFKLHETSETNPRVNSD